MIPTHVFVWDAIPWLDRIRRCRHVIGEHGEVCQMPASNRIHDVPDRTEEQDEHRRRVGESRTEE